LVRPVAATSATSSLTSEQEALVSTLRKAAKAPGSVPPSTVLNAIVNLEKAKIPPSDTWPATISSKGKRWRLIYTAASKDVQALAKGTKGGAGGYFPITACQKFDPADNSFENGVFFGPVAHLTFKGPYTMKGKQLSFDVDTMYIGLGPGRFGIPLKKKGKPLAEMEKSELRNLPFFLYAYCDEDIIVARGRSGGLALWVAADSAWQATSGVLQVYQ